MLGSGHFFPSLFFAIVYFGIRLVAHSRPKVLPNGSLSKTANRNWNHHLHRTVSFLSEGQGIR